MIKIGLGLLGVLAVAAPIGYKLYKDSNSKNLNIESNDSASSSNESELSSTDKTQETIEEQKSEASTNQMDQTLNQKISEEQQKILDWARDNGGCKVKIYDESSKNYVEISNLEKSLLDEFLEQLKNDQNKWKGLCQQANPNYGRKGNEEIGNELYVKKQNNGKWDIEEIDENE